MNFTSIAIVGIVALSSISLAYADGARCSARTLKGVYIYNTQGAEGVTPYAESGKEIYDGAGNVTDTYTTNVDSGVLKGTYMVDENCNGVTTYANGDVYTFYASPNGDSFTYIAVGKALSGTETRVSR